MKKLFTFLLLLLSIGINAQFVEWGHTIIRDTTLARPPLGWGNRGSGFAMDDADNLYYAGSFERLGAGYSPDSKNTVIKYNKTGKELWVKNINFQIVSIAADSFDNNSLYSLVLIDSATTIGGVNYGNPKKPSPNYRGTSVILLKTDSSLNIQWSRLLSDSTAFYTYSFSNQLYPKIVVTPNEVLVQQITDDNIANIYGYFRFKGEEYSANKLYSMGYNYLFRLILRLEKNPVGSNKEWALPILDNSYTHTANLEAIDEELEIDNEGNFYFKFLNRSWYYIGKTRYQNPVNNYKNYNSTILKISIADTSVRQRFDFDFGIDAFTVHPEGKLFVSGYFRDTTFYRGKQYISTPNTYETVLFYLKKNGDEIWHIQEQSPDRVYGIYLGKLQYRRGKLYARGLLMYANKSSFGGITVEGKNYPGGDHDVLLAKIDTFGNCLWMYPYARERNHIGAYRTFDGWQYYSMQVDKEGNICLGEFLYLNYNDKILNHQFFGGSIIYKIADFEIIRGNVYPGPYCAGDTIDIPYTLKGKYYPNNEFIAQLSDEDGKFLGGERELGRITANNDSVVKGVLPLFNVNTSGKYRIRILSTAPIAQSNYREDTLRLLIYSRDTANAGNDTLICRGQQVKLSTTGGSKWDWSPTTNLNDPTLRQPIATPKTDTKYRIIISDSSGCGDTDTDYVWVFLRKPLDIQAPFTDTTICRGKITKLFAKGSGGDSSKYAIQWYERRSTGDVSVTKGDSIVTTSTQDPKTFFAILTDNCTTQPDTQFYSIKALDELKVSIKSNKNNINPLTDTLICYNANLVLYAAPSGGNASQYQIEWSNTALLATGDSLALLPALPGTYYVTLKDGCTAGTVINQVVVTQRPPLSVAIQTGDSVCSKHPVFLNAKISGGDTTEYQIVWRETNSGWKSTLNPAQHTPQSNSRYTARVTDNCSPDVSDSIAVTIFPLPIPNFVVNNTIGCPPLHIQITDKSTGNLPVLNVWTFENSETIGNTVPDYSFTKSGVYAITLKNTNSYGCSDSVTKNRQITVFDKPQASFIVKPDRLEVDNLIQVYSTSRGAIKYQWDLGDGNFIYTNGDTATTYKDSGHYTIGLVVESGNHCTDTAYKTIKIFNQVFCILPNAFTPNGDGLNQLFIPVCDGVETYTLTIYSRWGQIIHQCQNCAWDGTYNNQPVADGVYMYKVEIVGESKKKEMVYGTVNLIR